LTGVIGGKLHRTGIILIHRELWEGSSFSHQQGGGAAKVFITSIIVSY